MEHFTYERTWKEIENMLDKAERKQNYHEVKMNELRGRKKVRHAANFKALEGVVKTLRWVLGDKDIDHPLE
jgi:hypothetical protein